MDISVAVKRRESWKIFKQENEAQLAYQRLLSVAKTITGNLPFLRPKMSFTPSERAKITRGFVMLRDRLTRLVQMNILGAEVIDKGLDECASHLERAVSVYQESECPTDMDWIMVETAAEKYFTAQFIHDHFHKMKK